VGDRDVPWSLVNVAHGVLDATDAAAPIGWPDPEPAGAAASWICRNSDVHGTRVEGDLSVRCTGEACTAWDWSYPDALMHEPIPLALDDLPPGLRAWAEPQGGEANAFMDACWDE
jgi:hypothetical protein